MSPIGWIDFSSEHREKVHTVIDLLSEQGVIDELGIGVVRDSFADHLFPGISTIQTRPKYFPLTALLLKDYLENEKHKRRPRSLGRYLEDEEKRCRIRLVESAREHDGDDLGIIGGTFGLRNDRDVVRRASSIYWNGLRQFGFVSPPHLSLSEFGRRLADDRHQLHALLQERGDERGDDLDAVDRGHRLRVIAPEVPEDYWETLSIGLTREEAVFLRHQIVATQPDSLVGQILSRDEAMDEVLLLRDDAVFEDFAELPSIRTLASEELRRAVSHARDFWRLVEGAHIRYNCLLQDRFGTEELLAEYESLWEDWRSRLPEYLEGWDTSFMWQVVSEQGRRVKMSTRAFLEGWLEECQQGAGNRDRCDALVKRQEIRNKGNRARLRPGNQEAINDWLGLFQAQYRFPEVRQLVWDIRSGENGEGGDHA